MVDELPGSIAELHATKGEAGLRALSGIGATIAAEITGWLESFTLENPPAEFTG